MIVIHYGDHHGTTGAHFASAAKGDPRFSILAATSGSHVRLARNPVAEGTLWVEAGVSSYPLDSHAVPFPTGGYLIDVHLHLATSLLQAALFDVVFVAQKDYVGPIRRVNPNTEWLPLAAPRSFVESERDPTFDVGFVGQARAQTRRERILTALNARFGMNDWRRSHSVDEMRDIYRRSRVVVNDPANGDINMRFFEAMASGAVLVSPALKNGSEEVASPGEHYVTADFDDIPAVVDAVRAVLHSSSSDAIGRRARALVDERHTYEHRLATMVAALERASLDAPVRSMSERDRRRHLASLAEAIADERLAREALGGGGFRDPQRLRLAGRTVAKSRKRRLLGWWNDPLSSRRG